MSSGTELLLILVILTNLALLGGSRLNSLIRIAAGQGVLLGLFPLLACGGSLSPRLVILAVVAGTLKGVVFPILLGRALREADIRREVEPFVGYNLSILAGIMALACSFWLTTKFPGSEPGWSRLAPSVAFFTITTGLFLIVSRHKALTQVLGYLIMENGIYVLGMALVGEIPMLVELGVLLDAFVATFVMGIAIQHINREFDHMDVAEMDDLRE